MSKQNMHNIIYEYWDAQKTRIKVIYYYNASGQLHRPWQEGPAVIWYYDTQDNRIELEHYYENGMQIFL